MTDTDRAWAESHIASLTPRQQRILYKALNAMGLRIGEGLDREIEALARTEMRDSEPATGDGMVADGNAGRGTESSPASTTSATGRVGAGVVSQNRGSDCSQPRCCKCWTPLPLKDGSSGERFSHFEPCPQHPNDGWAVRIDWMARAIA